MSTEHNLLQLLSAINVLKELPVMKLAENKTLVREIQNIVSGKNIAGIADDLRRDYMREKDTVMNSREINSDFHSPEFLSLYARYRGAAFNVLSEKKETVKRITTPVLKTDSVAFNAKKENPFRSDEILKLKETLEFKDAFNSIYSDKALQIRTANDPTQISSFIDYSPYVWNYIDYLAIPTLAQTIDLPINIATRQIPKIICDDEEMKDAILKTIKRTKFSELMQKMLLYSHLSPRGSLIVPIQDSGRIRFNIFNDTQFTYTTSYQYSRIDFHENLSGVSTLYVLGHLIQNGVTGHFLCPGFEPIYAIGKNRVYQLKDAAEAINIYLYTIKVLAVRAQVIIQKWGGEGQNDTLLRQMQQLTDNINSSLSLSTSQKLPEGASLDILNNNISEGFSKVSTIIKEYQGMLTGVNSDYFYGSDTAYQANNFNIHASHQNVRSQIQEPQLEPIYRFAINKMLELDNRFDKWRNMVDEFDIEFESLYEPTSMEKVDLDSKKIDNIIKMADYPELEPIFKADGLLNTEHNIPKSTIQND